jgi:transposase-like protein
MSLLRKIADEKDARACLLSVARSGETLRAWAKKHGVDGRSLRAWHRNLSRRGPSTLLPREPQLVELVRASSAAPPAQRYLVHVGGGSVEVGDDFDDQTLRRLLAVLRAC